MLPVPQHRSGRFRRNAWATSAASVLLGVSAVVAAQPGSALPVATAQQSPQVIPVNTVADCIEIACQRQPALAAARASLAAKEGANKGLNSIPFGRLLVRGFDIRQKQGSAGLSAASAELAQAELETAYAVTRTYYTALYARLQLEVVDGVIRNLEFYRDRVKDIVEKGADADLNQSTVDKLSIYVQLALAKREDATNGTERALAALREAMGIGQDCCSFQLADRWLPELHVPVDRCQIIEAALSQRGEMTKVLVAAEVIRLEVDAQNRIRFKYNSQTFASSADIHSYPVPPGEHNGSYRPGAIGIEMPAHLIGTRKYRVDQANSLSNRADAVVAKTRELLTLEGEDAYLRVLETSKKVQITKEAATSARRLARQTRANFEGGIKVRQDDLLTTDIMAGQAQGAYQEALFLNVLALANLERVTAGAIHTGLTTGAAAPAPVENLPNGQVNGKVASSTK